MAGRIRSIKPELLDDEAVSGLSDEAWRLWVSSWLLADDYGNCRAGDKYLAALVWQDSTRSPRVAEILRELRRASRVVVYVNGEDRYLHIRNWERHQRIDNAGKARVPASDHADSRTWDESRGESQKVAAVREISRVSPLDLRPPTSDPDHRDPDRGSGKISQSDLDAVYDAYPRKDGRKKGMARLRALATSRLKYDAIAAAVRNYAHRNAGTESKFLKHFDTFMNCWEDYSDGSPALESPASEMHDDAPPGDVDPFADIRELMGNRGGSHGTA